MSEEPSDWEHGNISPPKNISPCVYIRHSSVLSGPINPHQVKSIKLTIQIICFSQDQNKPSAHIEATNRRVVTYQPNTGI